MHVTGADIAVNQDGFAPVAFGKEGQSLLDAAEHQLIVAGNAVGMCADLALEHDDVAARQAFAKMIIGPSVAKTEFEDGAFLIANSARRPLKTSTLRLEAPDKAVQTAQIKASIRSLIPLIPQKGRSDCNNLRPNHRACPDRTRSSSPERLACPWVPAAIT